MLNGSVPDCCDNFMAQQSGTDHEYCHNNLNRSVQHTFLYQVVRIWHVFGGEGEGELNINV